MSEGLQTSDRGESDESRLTEVEQPSGREPHVTSNSTGLSYSITAFLCIVDGVQLLLVAWIVNWFVLAQIPMWGSVRLLVLVSLLYGIIRGYGWLILLASQLYLLAAETRSPSFLPSVEGVRYCFLSLTLVAYSFRFREIRSAIHAKIIGLLTFKAAEKAAEKGASAQKPDRSFLWVTAIKWIALSCGVTLLAMLLLAVVPFAELASDRVLKSSLARGDAVVPGAFLCVFILGWFVLIREFSWRQHTSSQAELYLRTTLAMELYRDLRLYVLRYIKQKKKLETKETS